jgi:dTDP-4-dehydrorhamnose reductase
MTTNTQTSTAPRNSAILFGASGHIGDVLLRHMTGNGWSVLGTYAHRAEQSLVHCDFTEADPVAGIDLKAYRYGVILSAICQIDQCKRDPELAARVNLDGTKRLLATLVENGVRPVFFSTDYVYDGVTGDYSETDPPSPNTEYGRQKAAMEEYIQSNHPEALIVRISKIFSVDPSDDTLLAEWYQTIQRNETIRTISDQRICPTYNGDLAAAVLALLDQEATGLFNVCQPKPYTRGELLREFLDALGMSYENTVEMKANEFGFLDERPGDVSLNPAKSLQFTGFQFTPMEEVFRRFQRNLT